MKNDKEYSAQKRYMSNKMTKLTIVIFLFLVLVLKSYSQETLYEGFIITERNDTIFGQFIDKDYYNKNKIKIAINNQERIYRKKAIKTIEYSDKVFVKGNTELTGDRFYLKTDFDCLKIYRKKQRNYIGKNDTDISSGRIKSSVKYYCNDFPDLNEYKDVKNDRTLNSLLIDYCEWKKKNPESKSYYEENRDRRGNINFKISFFLPGLGAEIRLNDEFSFESMMKSELYFSTIGIGIIPVWDNQLRYYYTTNKRKEKNKKIHKFTGSYLSAKNSYYILDNLNVTGLVAGWQYNVSRYWYYNIAFGGGTSFSDGDFYLMWNIDFGLVY